nr:ribonuclease H-like domain-containing protein [Tanacetum cinerariifolium]
MESLSPLVVSAAKLPIQKFDLWKMRIEQYFLMTDSSLWEVILNGDSPAPTRVIKGVVQRVAPTTERKLARKNQLKARDLEEQSLDDLFNSLKIYEAEVKSSSSASTSTQNIAFVSFNNTDSTNEPISVAASVSAVSAKIPVFALPNQIDADDLEEMDLKWQMAMLTMRARRFLQRSGRNLEANRPTSMGFDISRVECYNCHRKGHFAREGRSPKDTRRNVAAEPQRRNFLVETSTSNALVSQCDGVGSSDWIFQAKEEPTNYALMAFTSSSSSSSDNESDDSLPPSLIYDRYQLGDGYHVVPPPYTGTFMPPKPDLIFHNTPNVNETVHTAFTVELSPTKPDNDLSHTHRPSVPIIEDWVSNLEDNSEPEIPHNAPSFVQPNEQVTPPRLFVKPIETSILAANPKTAFLKLKIHRNSRNRKACFVCKSLTHLIKYCDYYEKKMAPTPVRNHAQRGNHQQYAKMTLLNPQRHVVPTTLLTKSKLVPITSARPVTVVVLKPHVTRPRQAKTVVTKPYSPPRRHINHSPSPKASIFPLEVIAVKAPMVIAVKGVQGKWEWKAKLEIQRVVRSLEKMCDKKNSVLFTDTECLVLSPEFKLSDENQVLLRVHRENNMYNVDLKNIVPSRDLTCLFVKTALDESNLWHRRLGHINFKTTNKLVKGSGPTWLFDIDTLTKTMNYQPVTAGNQSHPSAGVQENFDVEKAGEENVQQYMLFPVWSFGSNNPQNTDEDVAFEVKEPEFEGRKPQFEVHVFQAVMLRQRSIMTRQRERLKARVLLSLQQDIEI